MIVSPQAPIIYLITRGECDDATFAGGRRAILETIELAVAEKVSLVQIREKRLSAKLLFELTRSASELTRRSGTRLLVNDRADIALAAGADGVHLAGNSLPAAAIRSSFPTGFIIGASTHSSDAVVDAISGGADLVVFGPVFKTPHKGKPRGLAALSEVCEMVHPFPVIGLGGINGANYAAVLAAGASGIAGISAFNDKESLRSIVQELKGEKYR